MRALATNGDSSWLAKLNEGERVSWAGGSGRRGALGRARILMPYGVLAAV
jgi:hypothetical protein